MKARFEIVVGGYYRNSSNAVRKVIAIEGDRITYVVFRSGAGTSAAKHRTCPKPGTIGYMDLRSLRSWAMMRVTNRNIPWLGLPFLAGKPRLRGLGEPIRELFRQAEAMRLEDV